MSTYFYCRWRNLQTNNVFLSNNIQLVNDYYRVEKYVLCFQCCCFVLRRVSILQFFQKFGQSPQSLTFIQKFLNKFFLLYHRQHRSADLL